MIRPPKPLFDLLRILFRTNDDLLAWLSVYEYTRMADLIDTLPAPGVPRGTYVMRTVEQLQANALDETKLFDKLTDRFPGQRDLIETARDRYLSNAAHDEQPLDDPLGADVVDVPPELIARFEKIMGDRPTFLDVSYLATGYERAKSVAKLRMRFRRDWYSGTAFLVAADALLTAHHNVSNDGERAEAVEAIFDYERSASTGYALESLVVNCKVETVVGDSANDWALLRLDYAQHGRPTAALSRRPISVGDRVAIIQHPNGMVKQVALHNNLVTYADASRIQYLTDTMPGSSGSPVFDDLWNVVALHHAGGDLPIPGKGQVAYRNQGIPIECVRVGMRSQGFAF